MLAAFTLHPQKALLQTATLDVGLELLLPKIRKGALGLGHQVIEGGVMALNELVEQRMFWLMALVVGTSVTNKRTDSQGPGRHARILSLIAVLST